MKAFPRISHTDCFGYKHPSEDGMDLRDYFAGKAMQSLIQVLAKDTSVVSYTHITDMSFKLADAMMKAREQ